MITLKCKVNKESIISVLICINIIGLYCFEGMDGIGILFKICMLLLIGCGMVIYLPKLLKRQNSVFVLSCVFMIYSFFVLEHEQGFWSELFGVNVQTAISITLATLVGGVIYFYGNTIEKRMYILKCLSYAGLVLAIVTVAVCGGAVFAGLHSAGMTEYLEQYGLQSNSMGACFGISSIASMFLVYRERKTTTVFLLIVNMLFVVLSGSRAALLYLLVGCAVMYVLSGRKSKIVGRIFVISGAILLMLVLIMNVPQLYAMIGRRLENLFVALTGGKSSDSTSSRVYMIEYGIKLFKENIWTGHGFNAFRELYGKKTGNYTYAHNNYIELLVSGGIILTVIYYLRFVIVAKRLWSDRGKSKEAVLFLALVLSVMVIDMATVSYYYRIYFVVLGLAMACAYSNDTKIKNANKSVRLLDKNVNQ